MHGSKFETGCGKTFVGMLIPGDPENIILPALLRIPGVKKLFGYPLGERCLQPGGPVAGFRDS
jgi:hypothetical protein